VKQSQRWYEGLTVRRLCRRPHQDLAPGRDGVVACDCYTNDKGAGFGILWDAWDFVSVSSLRVPEIRVTLQDLQLRQPGKYQWRDTQTDVADEVAHTPPKLVSKMDGTSKWTL
jgi:hypothetical protein